MKSLLRPRRAATPGARRRSRPLTPPVHAERLEGRALFAATLLTDVNTSPAGSSPMDMTEVDGTLFFTAQDSSRGRELYKSDGTAAGTVLLKDIAPFGGWSYPSGFTPAGRTLFFHASDGARGPELWKSDGTPGGTVMVKDIYPGPSGSISGGIDGQRVAVADTLFFIASDPERGSELWKSDGTEAGTTLVKEIYAGRSYAPPQNLTAFGEGLLFTSSMPGGATGLWRSDGTEAGTVLVKQLGEVNVADAYELTVAGGRVFFTAATPAAGRELWVSDGTEAGTSMVKDLKAGPACSSTSHLTAAGDGVLFAADDGSRGVELWKSDGTAEGTVLVKDIAPGGTLSHTFPRNLIAWAARFSSRRGRAGRRCIGQTARLRGPSFSRPPPTTPSGT